MAKGSKKSKKPAERRRIIVTSDLIKKLQGKAELPYNISQASLKDDFCSYSYIVKEGLGVNDQHDVKGSKMVTDDLIQAFGKLNVHLAVIDDVFKHKDIEIDDIDNFHADEITGMYSVSGIRIKGSDENESVVLVGNKYVSCSGSRISIETPKIPLDNLSSYKWYNELKAAVDVVRKEVSLYKEGKYVAYEEDEETTSSTQMTIGTEMEEGQSNVPDLSNEFEAAKA